MSRSIARPHVGDAVALGRDERDERPIDPLEQVGDHLVLLLEPVDHGSQLRVAASQVGEDAAVLERVVVGDDAAVGLAEGAERPVVLADRHPVDERADRARVGRPARDLLDQVAQAGQLGAKGVVDVDQVPAGGLLVIAVATVRIRRRRRRPLGVVPRSLGAEARHRRRASPWPRAAPSPAPRWPAAPVQRGRAPPLRARSRPARAPPARPPRRSAGRRRRRTTERMYVLIPVVSVSSLSCSAQSCGEPSRNPAPLPKLPLTLNRRRTSAGPAPGLARPPRRSRRSSPRSWSSST